MSQVKSVSKRRGGRADILVGLGESIGLVVTVGCHCCKYFSSRMLFPLQKIDQEMLGDQSVNETGMNEKLARQLKFF